MTTTDVATQFSIADYVVFLLMLMVSAGIGFYYACSGSKQRTASEYLLANRSMGILPIALSILASSLSSVSMLGIPVEIYYYGTAYWYMVFSIIIVMPLVTYICLPVFHHLQLTSAYEYLERRFSPTVRKIASITFIIQTMLFMSVVTYAPAISLSQVTGLHVWGSVAAIGIVCIFYTTIGGMKAVMWTDVVQVTVMFATMLVIVIEGLLLLGGFRNMLDVAKKGGRLDTLTFDVDPIVRTSFWNIFFGGGIHWSTIYGASQTQVQRYLTTPSLRSAQIALWWNLLGLLISMCSSTLAGLVVYAYYANCDPLTTKSITTADQLLPLFVMDTLGKYPGLPGFFVAGIFSGSLSTLSSGFNSLAAVTLEDFIRPMCLKNLSDERAGLISKFIAFGYGLSVLALVAIVEQLENLLQAAHQVIGIIGGPLLGVFVLGMCFPWANSKGAITGLITGLVFILWMGIGAHIVKVPSTKLSVSTVGCSSNNATVMTALTIPSVERHVSSFYKVCFHLYPIIGWGMVLAVGLVVSIFTGIQNPEKLDARLFSPPTRLISRILPTKIRNYLKLNLMPQTRTTLEKKQETDTSDIYVFHAEHNLSDYSLETTKM